MNQFVNGFRCAVKNDGSEFILKFTQENPVIADGGAISNSEIFDVGSFVMHPSCAKDLAAAISKVLTPNTEE